MIYATRILARAGLRRGADVLVSETHGMSQRGGSVQAHVRFNAGQAPLIRRGTADVLLALDATEALRALTFVRAGGLVF